MKDENNFILHSSFLNRVDLLNNSSWSIFPIYNVCPSNFIFRREIGQPK
jgi:hypothetical protein